jgi:hypothetical protein
MTTFCIAFYESYISTVLFNLFSKYGSILVLPVHINVRYKDESEDIVENKGLLPCIEENSPEEECLDYEPHVSIYARVQLRKLLLNYKSQIYKSDSSALMWFKGYLMRFEAFHPLFSSRIRVSRGVSTVIL